jgi:plastocyanin
LAYLLKNRQLARILAVTFALFTAASADANAVVIQVLAEDGQPVADVAVFILQDGIQPAAPASAPTVMDQIDTRFVPHKLVVQKGTAVDFPNSDVIAHSLSPTTSFCRYTKATRTNRCSLSTTVS